MLHSYNNTHPDREVPADRMDLVRIVGEVIYRSGSGMAGGN
jgi:phage repressor protein C with HTH and peptisase S24 domain